jgi:cell wall-associated NlpC family hydrolase
LPQFIAPRHSLIMFDGDFEFPGVPRHVAAMQARQMPPAPRPAPQAAPAAAGNYLRFDGRYAAAPISLPAPVQHAVNAVNQIQNKPYRRGGGHASVDDNAYDCSGSVSYALIKAGLLRAPLSSGAFASYGQPGPGRFITIYVKPGEHVFMTICGLRLDTTGGQSGEGPRWRAKPRSADGFIMRHPAGF